MEGFHLDTKWEDITCPICLSHPHNSVLLHCSSFTTGCRPFLCHTDHLLSNCLHRFQLATSPLTEKSTQTLTLTESTKSNITKPSCPLCRGDVTGWVVVKEARAKLDCLKRSCEDEKCKFFGTYLELREHAMKEHPHACPSKVDPARQQDWENLQQSFEIIDVLSTIHSEVPNGVVLGDYVIEYGENGSGEDEYEDFPGDDGNWWTSCILYQVFDGFRSSRNRRRGRVSRENRRVSFENSNSDEGSVVNMEIGEYRVDDEFVTSSSSVARGRTGHRSSRRRQSRFHDN